MVSHIISTTRINTILQRCISTASNYGKFVFGCGSCVVDHICKVQTVPKPGGKGYFQSPTKILEKSVVGGVTLNHLSWASILGVPTGLLAMQGTDASGRIIREKLKQFNMNQDYIHVDKDLTSSQSYVFVERDGERSIIMASGATSMITDQRVSDYFADAIENHASMVTTEISQVPLKGVIRLLQLAKEAGLLTVVDLDVTPSVAINEAGLGNLDELKQVLQLADVLKPAKHAAHELLTLLNPKLEKRFHGEDITRYLQDISGSQLVAMTNSGKETYMATENHLLKISTEKIKVVDSTGAGDAFLGGIIAGLYFNGIPTTEDEVRELGKLGNITGAANCQVLGGLPENKSREFVIEKLKNSMLKFDISKHYEEFVMDEPLHEFKESLGKDVGALSNIWECIDYKSVSNFINLIFNCEGNILLSGIGKSGLVAGRMAASLCSIGIPAFCVHANEWAHGDLGKIQKNDVVVVVSHSGNTEEVVFAMELIKRKKVPMLAIIGFSDSVIGKLCKDSHICYGRVDLMEPLGGIPTTSIILQDAVVNGVICGLIRMKNLSKEDFLFNHPGGMLGKTFSSELMNK